MDGNELADQVELGLVSGAEVFEIFAKLGVVFLGGFVTEDDGFGGQAMLQSVLRGGVFAFVGDGAVG